MLEEDARNVLKFMASNGLVANASKTALLFMNVGGKKVLNGESQPIKIKVGNSVVTQVHSAKLLGMQIDDNQEWSSQITGQGGVISSLNSRLFLLRRLSNYISKKRLLRVADSLYTSKIRYGVQLLSKVRIIKEDPVNGLFKKIQVTQNKFARFLAGTSLLDKMRTDKIFEDLKFLSVNQINAQIKLQEVWKSKNLKNYPLQWSNDPKRVDSRTRSIQTESLMVMGNGQKCYAPFTVIRPESGTTARIK